MRGDRRLAGLILAGAIAGAALVVPVLHHGLLPAPGDVVVGWALLGSAVAAAKFRWSALLLGLAGTLWISVGLSPYLHPWVARTALMPTALVAVVVIALPRQLPRTSLAWCAAAVAVLAAVVGGAGYLRGTVLVMGLTMLGAAVGTHHPTARSLQLGTGFAMTLDGLWGSGFGGPDPAALANLHDLVLVAASVTAAGLLVRTSRLAGRAQGLGRLLGEALGQRDLTVWFPGPDGWLDERGRPASAPSTGGPIDDLAWWSPEPTVDPALRPVVNRLLAAAGDGARLRAALRARADEVGASRARLVSAASEERDRLVARLREGPLSRLEQAAEGAGPDLADRFAAAGDLVRSIVEGLDPVAAAGGLGPALQELCRRSGATFTDAASAATRPDVARVLWFACAEALANAGKHAPSATVTVTLTDMGLRVADNGPGGADPSGGGLSGLRERVTSVGGTLSVTSTSSGTEVEVELPATRFPSWDRASSPMPGRLVAGRLGV